MNHPVVLAVVVEAKSRMRLSAPPRAHRMDVDERHPFVVLGHTSVVPCSQVLLQEGKQVLVVEMMQPFAYFSQPKASRVRCTGDADRMTFDTKSVKVTDA
jgi:hypothetical protein